MYSYNPIKDSLYLRKSTILKYKYVFKKIINFITGIYICIYKFKMGMVFLFFSYHLPLCLCALCPLDILLCQGYAKLYQGHHLWISHKLH